MLSDIKETVEKDYDEIYRKEIKNINPLSIQVVYTALGAGSSIDVQISNDAVNWESRLSSSEGTETSGSVLVIEPSAPYSFLRVVTDTASEGSYTVYFLQKK